MKGLLGYGSRIHQFTVNGDRTGFCWLNQLQECKHSEDNQPNTYEPPEYNLPSLRFLRNVQYQRDELNYW